MIGQKLGSYELLEEIGQGGMARHALLHRRNDEGNHGTGIAPT